MSVEIRIFGLEGIPEIESGDDLATRLVDAAERLGGLEVGDVVVVAQKVVSKAEGRIVRLADIVPSPQAIELAADRDPRHVQVILDETARIVRARPPLLISETRHGFVCASAGVDASNAKGAGTLILLPLDPDESAAAIRESLHERTGVEVGVVVSDSFGRAWRRGTTGVALGVAGVTAVLDLNGRRDEAGYELHGTEIAIADELAAAAELVLGKLERVPAAVIRGVAAAGDGSGRELVIPAERDLFR
ncbi:MAG: coenzyme F420-0:L-glutamate ligase [Gaiellaceae bacterium MAG52_C11]|nr:coenzyme F420-0:L-glutamate ligase [Candidatus Gaiellasilicea maunaloa]